ncbi:MAG: DUF2877 domain-containing protein [Nitrospirales bacterium]|nr:DUF2877 domain-containing protein [Nitrospirales bacterium]
MICVNAIVAGSHARRDRFSGQVHSVFRNACNIMLADDDMLSLLSRDMGCVPHGIRLATPSKFSFLDRIRAGQTVGCRAGILRFQGESLEANLLKGEIWCSNHGFEPIDWKQRNIQQAWQTAWEALQRAQAAVPIDNHDVTTQYVSSNATDNLQRLIHAVRRNQLMAATHIAEGMVGCGCGLTPSGDDLLVGYLAGIYSAAQSERQLAGHSTIVRVVAGRAHATSDISRVYLEQACAGAFSETITNLLASISHGRSTAEVRCHTRQALCVGSSSGREGVLGCLLGLVTWVERLPPMVHRWFDQ